LQQDNIDAAHAAGTDPLIATGRLSHTQGVDGPQVARY